MPLRELKRGGDVKLVGFAIKIVSRPLSVRSRGMYRVLLQLPTAKMN